MNMEEAARIIRETKYRNWWFAVAEHPIHLVVTIGFYTENSDLVFEGRAAGPTMPVTLEFAIDGLQVMQMDAKRLGDWVYSHVKQILLHEAGEWFIWQGDRPYYPHARSVGGAVTLPI